MKSYRKDGRVRVILKLRLPRLFDETKESSEFNAFYERLAEEYISSAEKLPHGTERDSRPTTVNIDFSIYTDEYIKRHPKSAKRLTEAVIIKREAKINAVGEIRRVEHIDIYNEKTFLFIK